MRRSASPTREKIAAARCLAVLRIHPPHQQRHRDILQSREFRQQMMELIDEPDRAIAQVAALGVAQPVHGGARDLDRAAGRQIEAAQQLQQRRLARSRRADDGDALAGAHRDRAPRSTWISPPPWMKSFARSVPWSTMRWSSAYMGETSIVSQGFCGQQARGSPGGIEGRQAGEHEREAADPHEIASCTRAGRSLMKYTRASRNLKPDDAFQSVHQILQIDREEHAEQQPAGDAEQRRSSFPGRRISTRYCAARTRRCAGWRCRGVCPSPP